MANPHPVTAWKKGCAPPNPKGRPYDDQSLTNLMKDFLHKIPEGEKVSNKEKFIQKVYEKAVRDGDAVSIKLIWNYIDGLPPQAIDLTTKGQSINYNIINFQDDKLGQSQSSESGIQESNPTTRIQQI